MNSILVPAGRSFYLLLSLSIFICAAYPCVAQEAAPFGANDVVYDRSTDKLINFPRTVNRKETVNIIIENANTIMYEYSIEVTGKPRTPNDWGNFNDLITRAGRAAASGANASSAPGLAVPTCNALAAADQSLKDLTKQLNDEEALPIHWHNLGNTSAPDKSYTVAESRRAWDNLSPKIAELRVNADKVAQCSVAAPGVSQFNADFTTLNGTIKRLEDKVNAPHVAQLASTLLPETDYEVTVHEYFQTKAGSLKEIEAGKRSFKFSPASNILTLSVGPLFSTIQDRSYQARKTPASTENVLVVEGNSKLRPEGVALLNYMLPGLDNDLVGMALSAGPVIRFGSKSDLATLGFFAGTSINLYRRFYVTPGIHIGEFADFPVGFGDRQTIPANFGELTPIKRWTARFAFGISFQTPGFGDLVKGQSGKPEVTAGKEAGSGGKTGSLNPLDSTEVSQLAAHGLIDSEEQLRLMAVEAGIFAKTAKLPVRNIASLAGKGTADGGRLTLVGDTPINGYRTYSNGGRFYLVIPQANGLFKPNALRERGFTEASVKRLGNHLVFIFTLRPGTKVSLEEKFNRLSLSFVSSED